MLVIDSFIALSWLFQRVKADEVTLAEKALQALTADGAVVPTLWHTEIANGLLAAERRKVVTEAQTFDYLGRLSRLPIGTDDVPVPARREIVMSLAREYSLTARNATYLDLTLRFGARLASFDAALIAAVHGAGGEIL